MLFFPEVSFSIFKYLLMLLSAFIFQIMNKQMLYLKNSIVFLRRKSDELVIGRIFTIEDLQGFPENIPSPGKFSIMQMLPKL